MMPFAVMTSINTLSWVGLTQHHDLSADTTWDPALFDTDNPAVILYETGYFIEIALLNFCGMSNSVRTVDFLQLLLAVQALTLCVWYFVNSAKFESHHFGDQIVNAYYEHWQPVTLYGCGVVEAFLWY